MIVCTCLYRYHVFYFILDIVICYIFYRYHELYCVSDYLWQSVLISRNKSYNWWFFNSLTVYTQISRIVSYNWWSFNSLYTQISRTVLLSVILLQLVQISRTVSYNWRFFTAWQCMLRYHGLYIHINDDLFTACTYFTDFFFRWWSFFSLYRYHGL